MNHDASTIIHVVNQLNQRWVLLTTWSTSRGEIFKVYSFGTKLQREVPLVLEVLEFPYNTCGIGGREQPCQEPAGFVQSCYFLPHVPFCPSSLSHPFLACFLASCLVPVASFPSCVRLSVTGRQCVNLRSLVLSGGVNVSNNGLKTLADSCTHLTVPPAVCVSVCVCMSVSVCVCVSLCVYLIYHW